MRKQPIRQNPSQSMQRAENPAVENHPDFLKMLTCFKLFGTALLFAAIVYGFTRNTTAAGGVVGAAVVVLSLFHLPFGIFVQLVLLSLENAVVFYERLSISMIMGMIIGVSFLFRIVVLKIVVPLPQKFIFITTAWICLSLLWCIDIEPAAKALRTFLACIVFCFIFLNAIRDKKTLFLVISGLILGGLISSSWLMFGPVQYASFSAEEMGKALLHEDANPVTLGRAIALGLLVLLPVSLGKGKTVKLLAASIIGLCLLAIMTKTQTRMALITALAVPPLALILCSESKARLKYFFIASIVAVLSLAVFNVMLKSDFMTERARERYEDDDWDRTKSIRFGFWSDAFQAFQKRPLHGYGFMGSSRALEAHRGRSVHNNFFAVLVDLGLIGLTLFAVIFLTLYNQLRKVLNFNLKWLGMMCLLYPLFSGLTSVNYVGKDFWYALAISMIVVIIDRIKQQAPPAQ